MKRTLVILLFLVAIVPAFAQEEKGMGYLFVAPGVAAYGAGGNSSGLLHFGGGGEGFIYKGLTAGGEIGYSGPYSNYSEGVGILSANGAYHFRAPDRKIVPFLTAGYSLAFRGDSANGLNFGGGATCWFKERYGLRLEFRDNYFPQGDGTHMLGFRVGFAFR